MERRSVNNANLSFAEVNGLKKKGRQYTKLQVKVGRSKLDLEVPATVTGEGTAYLFVSVPAMNLVLGGRAKDGGYELTTTETESAEAVRALKAFRRPTKSESKPTAPKMPEELAAMLAKVPKGYKLVFADSGYKLVKMRVRAKK